MPFGPIDAKVTIGNLIAIAVASASLVYGYAVLNQEVRNAGERVARIEGRLEGIEGLVRSEQITNSRLLTQLQVDMSYIKTAVEELRARRD